MDISRASNFERYMFDMAGRDADALAALWRELAAEGSFDIAGTPVAARVRASGFVSGRSTHADRIATIRDVKRRYDLLVDPHTADGIHVGCAHREQDVPMICLETAQPAKFAATVREALAIDPPRPAAFAGLESRPQHFTVLPADAAAVAAFIRDRD